MDDAASGRGRRAGADDHRHARRPSRRATSGSGATGANPAAILPESVSDARRSRSRWSGGPAGAQAAGGGRRVGLYAGFCHPVASRRPGRRPSI
ncbi:hypothetical protein SAMN05216505_101685 [Streptomyces prasinopilosus]|uniref:Uncharacterized protein n=1 Tax=Streptomyces prasinopilosus TaxID=67344 RepID=A0A1G6JI64_9ACTN|nr:hypothetical protein SAMN05216505_101685 [Streptomyces prasinopilosus]